MDNSEEIPVDSESGQFYSQMETLRYQVWDLFDELGSLKVDSQIELSSVVNYHRTIIDKTIDDLASGVCDLQAQLSVTARERNGFIPIPKSEDAHNSDTQDADHPELIIPDTEEHVMERRESADRMKCIVPISMLERAVEQQKEYPLSPGHHLTDLTFKLTDEDDMDDVEVAAARNEEVSMNDVSDHEQNYSGVGFSLPLEEVPVKNKGSIIYKTSHDQEFLKNGCFPPRKSYYKPTGRPRGRPRGSKSKPEGRHLEAEEAKVKRPVGRPRKYADDHPKYLPKGSRPRGRPRGSVNRPRPGNAEWIRQRHAEWLRQRLPPVVEEPQFLRNPMD